LLNASLISIPVALPTKRSIVFSIFPGWRVQGAKVGASDKDIPCTGAKAAGRPSFDSHEFSAPRIV
jgi:hypothetical protein